jgi:hypothetical protein
VRADLRGDANWFDQVNDAAYGRHSGLVRAGEEALVESGRGPPRDVVVAWVALAASAVNNEVVAEG